MVTLAPESRMASMTSHSSPLLPWKGLSDCFPFSIRTESEPERCVAHRRDSDRLLTPAAANL